MKRMQRSEQAGLGVALATTALLCSACLAGGHATVSPSSRRPRRSRRRAPRTCCACRTRRATRTPTRSSLFVPTPLQEVISVKQQGDWSVRLKRRDTGKKNERSRLRDHLDLVDREEGLGDQARVLRRVLHPVPEPGAAGQVLLPGQPVLPGHGREGEVRGRASGQAPPERRAAGVLVRRWPPRRASTGGMREYVPRTGTVPERALLRALPAAGSPRCAFAPSAHGHAVVQPSASRPAEQQVYTLTVPSERSSDVVSVSLQVPADGRVALIVRKAPGWKVQLAARRRPDRGRALVRKPIQPDQYDSFAVHRAQPRARR